MVYSAVKHLVNNEIFPEVPTVNQDRSNHICYGDLDETPCTGPLSGVVVAGVEKPPGYPIRPYLIRVEFLAAFFGHIFFPHL